MSIISTDTIESLSGKKILNTTGSILQANSIHFSNTFTTTSLSFVDITNFSVAITPTSATNKILVFGHIAIGTQSSSSSIHKILCNGTEIYPNTPTTGRHSGWIEYTNNNSDITRNSPFMFLHTPGSTSTQTYQVQCKVNDNGYTATVNRTYTDSINNGYSVRSASSITVLEIVA
jgi:hypothetical protein